MQNRKQRWPSDQFLRDSTLNPFLARGLDPDPSKNRSVPIFKTTSVTEGTKSSENRQHRANKVHARTQDHPRRPHQMNHAGRHLPDIIVEGICTWRDIKVWTGVRGGYSVDRTRTVGVRCTTTATTWVSRTLISRLQSTDEQQPLISLHSPTYLLPTSKSRDTKARTKIQNLALKSFRYCALV